MARLRIVCKRDSATAAQGEKGGLRFNRVPLSFPDCNVFLVRDDGSEEPFHGVRSVTWSVSVERPSLVMATIEMIDVDADVEADVEVPEHG